MPLTLYPFATIRTHNIKENTAEKIGQLWQNNFAKLTKNEPYYGVYLNYESDFTGWQSGYLHFNSPTLLKIANASGQK